MKSENPLTDAAWVTEEDEAQKKLVIEANEKLIAKRNCGLEPHAAEPKTTMNIQPDAQKTDAADKPKEQGVLAPRTCSAKCATCKFFDRAFPQNRQLGYCKGIQIQRLDGGGIAISRRIYAWLPGDEALRLMDDFGCAYHSPNAEPSERANKT